MNLKSKFPWDEVGAQADKRRAEIASSEPEKYWIETAPGGGKFEPDGPRRCCFTTSNGTKRRSCGLPKKPGEQEALMIYREETGSYGV